MSKKLLPVVFSTVFGLCLVFGIAYEFPHLCAGSEPVFVFARAVFYVCRLALLAGLIALFFKLKKIINEKSKN